MLSPALKPLLALIREYEGGPGMKGYGTVYGGSPVKADVSKMTLDEVYAFQKKMLDAGSKSTACGGYQFIRKTLLATIKQMKLTGRELWAPDLQDLMAIHLMKLRGLDSYLSGEIGPEAFANNLAKEWASLPVVTPINGKKPGQSYYDGDGINSAHHKPAAVLSAIDALKAAALPASPPPTPVPPAQPVGFWAWLWSLLTWKT